VHALQVSTLVIADDVLVAAPALPGGVFTGSHPNPPHQLVPDSLPVRCCTLL